MPGLNDVYSLECSSSGLECFELFKHTVVATHNQIMALVLLVCMLDRDTCRETSCKSHLGDCLKGGKTLITMTIPFSHTGKYTRITFVSKS